MYKYKHTVIVLIILRNILTMETHYTRYYLAQGGGGLNDIGRLYHAPLIRQQGRGSVGDFFSAVIRHLRPLFMSGLNALKEQGLKTGSAVLNDLGKKPIKQIMEEQANIALHELARKGINKMTGRGRGIKRPALSNFMHLGPHAKRVKRNSKKKQKIAKAIQHGGKRRHGKKSVNKRRRKRVLDIFG